MAKSNQVPFEKYVESTVAMEVLEGKGKDALSVLKSFGITFDGYANIASYWGEKMAADFLL